MNRFFDDDDPPTEAGGYMDEYRMIRAWIGSCIDNRRFCPADDAEYDVNHNISCYITDEGRENLLPLHEKNAFMRFAQQGGGQNSMQGNASQHGGARGGGHDRNQTGVEDSVLFTKMAARIHKMHGPHLFKMCHMGPERCVYMYAMMGLCAKFAPDFRGLGSHKAFHYEKHMRKMGFGGFLPGIKDYVEEEAPPFARQVVFKERDQVKSIALGVNPWSLISIVSLAGQILLHPTVSDEVANGIVTQILAKAPPGSTPGNICPTRFFKSNTKPVRMYISAEDRPNHFLRPDDTSFPTTGKLSLAKGVDQFLPEDLLPCAALTTYAKTLGCRIDQVPASVMKV